MNPTSPERKPITSDLPIDLGNVFGARLALQNISENTPDHWFIQYGGQYTEYESGAAALPDFMRDAFEDADNLIHNGNVYLTRQHAQHAAKMT